MAPETVLNAHYNDSLDTWLSAITMLTLSFGWGPYHYKKNDVEWEGSGDSPYLRTITRFFRENYVDSWLRDGKVNFKYHRLHNKLNLFYERFPGDSVVHPSLQTSTRDWIQFREFCKKMFILDPKQRPTVSELLFEDYMRDPLIAWKTGDFSEFTEERMILKDIVEDFTRHHCIVPPHEWMNV